MFIRSTSLRSACISLGALALAGAVWANQTASPADAPAATGETATNSTAKPRYSAANIRQAFNYMDKNRDGKISRDEASGFRGVARHFDRADTNQDSHLSSQEFDTAMHQAQDR